MVKIDSAVFIEDAEKTKISAYSKMKNIVLSFSSIGKMKLIKVTINK